MAPSKLKQIAAGMRQSVSRAQPPAWTEHTLPGDLQLILHRPDDEQWRLLLRRQRVSPSPTEITICANVFGVPEGTEPVVYTKKPYQVAELTWREYA